LIEFPDKKYKTIVIDPPWPVKPLVLKMRPNLYAIPYPTMTIQEITDFPINNIVDPESCNMFMWTTMTYLPQSLEILKAWGFNYHAVLSWYKTNGRTLWGIKRNVEFVIVAYKGKFSLNTHGKSISAFFAEPTMTHSKKPQIFYDMLTRTAPAPRIDVFARIKRVGWDAYGNEVKEPESLEAFIDG